MAVSVRRKALTLWTAWVAAAAIGAAATAATARSVLELLPQSVLGGSMEMALGATPVALLQYLVLRSLGGFSSRAAGIWAASSVLAAAVAVPATLMWYEQGASRLPTWMLTNNNLLDLFMAGDRWIYALLLGIAQGLVLASVLRHQAVMAVWAAVNVLAIGVAPYVRLAATPAGLIGPPPSPAAMAVSAVELWVPFAAITGAMLVVMSVRWGLLKEPAPAARSLPAPRP